MDAAFRLDMSRCQATRPAYPLDEQHVYETDTDRVLVFSAARAAWLPRSEWLALMDAARATAPSIR